MSIRLNKFFYIKKTLERQFILEFLVTEFQFQFVFAQAIKFFLVISLHPHKTVSVMMLTCVVNMQRGTILFCQHDNSDMNIHSIDSDVYFDNSDMDIIFLMCIFVNF